MKTLYIVFHEGGLISYTVAAEHGHKAAISRAVRLARKYSAAVETHQLNADGLYSELFTVYQTGNCSINPAAPELTPEQMRTYVKRLSAVQFA